MLDLISEKTSTPLSGKKTLAAAQLQELFSKLQPDPHSAHPLRIQKTLFLARRLQERATEVQTAAEKRQQAELDRMLQNPSDKVTLAQMTDQAFRTNEPHRAVEHLIHILDVQGVPRFFKASSRSAVICPGSPYRWSRNTCRRKLLMSFCPVKRSF